MTSTQFDVRGQSYGSIILPLACQEKSKLYDRVFVKPSEEIEGKTFYQDQIGTWTMKAKTSVNAKTPQNDPNLSRTRIDIQTFNDARTFDRSLELQAFADPVNVASVCLQSAIGVTLDTLIYSALGGTTYRGEIGAASVSFPAGKTIPVNMDDGATNTGLTVKKIRRANKILDDKNVPSSDRTFLASATAKEQLLGTTQVTSSDYNNVKALVNGDVDTFMGFKFVFLSSDIIVPSSNIADYFAFHKTGLALGMLEELFLRIDERKDLSYAKQVYYEFSGGAGRLEEAKVIKIKGDETVVV